MTGVVHIEYLVMSMELWLAEIPTAQESPNLAPPRGLMLANPTAP